MKMQTSTLDGPYLDAAVGMVEGLKDIRVCLRPFHVHEAFRAVHTEGGKELFVPGYSTDWRSGGPIVERERITVIAWDEILNIEWSAHVGSVGDYIDTRLPLDQRYSDISGESGPTPLIAAMRSHVARAYGDEVEIAE